MYLTHKNLADYWVCDIEADGIDAKQIWCIVLTNAATQETVEFYGDTLSRFPDFVRGNPSAYYIGHNFLSYDWPTLERLLQSGIRFDQVIDTLILSYLYDPKMFGGHSLEAWGVRFKFPKDLFSDFSQFSVELLARCRQDVKLNLRVFLELTKRMRTRGFSEKSVELEHQVREIVDRQEKFGWYFDVTEANKLHAHLRQLEQDYTLKIREVFKPQLKLAGTYKYRERVDGTPFASYLRHLEEFDQVTRHGPDYDVYEFREFNIGSPQQRVERLLELGWKPEKMTKGGNPQADEESIVAFAEKHGEARIGLIGDWLSVNGRANMIETWLGKVGDDSRMHGRVFTCGAQSRRMTHSGPNTANIPSNEAKFGEAVRKLWTVRNPSVQSIVGYDAASVQMRDLAHLLPDPNAGRRYWDTDFCPDPHEDNARVVGIPRRPMKNVFYAFIFGAYDPKLGWTAEGRDPAFGAFIRRKLYELTPGLEEVIKRAESEFDQNGGFLSCIDGGFVRCPKRSAVLNYKIQPLEAVMMKQATVFIDQRTKHLDQHKIADVHDEGQHETAKEDAKEFGKAATQAIADAGVELGFRVPMAGSYKVGKSWAETH